METSWCSLTSQRSGRRPGVESGGVCLRGKRDSAEEEVLISWQGVSAPAPGAPALLLCGLGALCPAALRSPSGCLALALPSPPARSALSGAAGGRFVSDQLMINHR